MLRSAREQGLEGVVAKRKVSRYEAGRRGGASAKHRLNNRQELVIGGYVPGAHGVESIIVGYYKESELIYVESGMGCAGDTEASIPEVAASGSCRMSLLESARNTQGP
jgi:bifunctional non-homologous end joining protein LigD